MKTRIHILTILFILSIHSGLQAETLSFSCSENSPQADALKVFIDRMGANIRTCSDKSENLWFAHRFSGLKKEKQEITQAIIRIDIEALSENLSYNDMTLLTFIENNRMSRSWSETIGTHGPITGSLPYRWESGKEASIEKNLKSLPCEQDPGDNLLTYLNHFGFIDVIVEDDTAVSKIDLTLTYSPINYSLKLDEGHILDDETVLFPIEIVNPDQKEIIGIDGAISFDNTILESFGQSFHLNESISNLNYDFAFNPENNKFTIYACENNIFKGEGAIAHLILKIIGNDGQQTDVIFTESIINRVNTDSQGTIFDVPLNLPLISLLPPVTINENASAAVGFTVYDQKTQPAQLIVTFTSSNEDLIPEDNDHILISGEDTNRTLTITPASGKHGTATIELTVTDSDNLTASALLTVHVLSINGPPDFDLIARVESLEDAGENVVDQFIQNVHPGEHEPEQSIEKIWINNISDTDLFTTLPKLIDNKLMYTPSTDAFGVCTIEVCIQDNGSIIHENDIDTTCKTGTISILPVNDMPQFEVFTQSISLPPGETTYTKDQFLYNIITGPLNESDQHIIAYNITPPTNPDLFKVLPHITDDLDLVFELNQNAVGTDSFSISIQDSGDTQHNGHNLSLSKILSIEAKGYSVTGQVLYYGSDIPVPDVTVFLVGPEGSYVAHTSSNGEYQFDQLKQGDYTLEFTKTSDLGGVKASDASRMGHLIVGLENINCYTRMAADLFRDNLFTGTNASKIARYSVGLISCLTIDCHHWAFAPDNAQCNHVNDIPYPYTVSFHLDSNRNNIIRGVRMGDTTGNWSPQANLLNSSIRNTSSITIDAYQHDMLNLALYLNPIMEITGVDVKLDYRSDALFFKDIQHTEGLNNYKNVINTNSQNVIKMAIYTLNTEYFNGNEDLAYLNFQIAGQAGTSTTLSLSMFDINETSANGGLFINNQVVQKIHVNIKERPPFEWRLISLSVTPDEPDVSILLPDAKGAYKYIDGAFVPVKQLKPGLGYWVLLPHEFDFQTLSTISGPAFTAYDLKLQPGLHLLGGIDSDTATPVIDPEDAIKNMYTCSQANGCTIVESIEKNHGVWVEILKYCQSFKVSQ